ncbi:Lipase 4 [Golovinomyces cichoracearum]|uniref:Patatin-like phospholipase domain-containing protein n=1 Tax=Golovinomyces cichoracearum TaxID=62708 RepID=A0A420IYA3_9PEZI|nr:Lipase 4 [Golovinomyces cichoracearum]
MSFDSDLKLLSEDDVTAGVCALSQNRRTGWLSKILLARYFSTVSMVSSGMKASLSYTDPPHVSSSYLESWTLLEPIARTLKNAIQLVNHNLLSPWYNLKDGQKTTPNSIEERKKTLHLQLKSSLTVDQWKETAKELDILENNEAWKYDNDSNDFDAPLLEMRLRQLDQARESGDIQKMLSLIRTAISRDLGGIGNVRLYIHSHTGTKDIIERYIDSTLDTIRTLVRLSKLNESENIEIGKILEKVLCARQAFGRSALLLSGGGTFGMNHIGVLKALFDAKSLPRIISGSSAGSIVCSVLCTKTDAELPDLLSKFAYGDLAVFTEKDKPEGILERLQRVLTQGSWIDNKHLIRVMKDHLGDMTFQEAYNRTRRILNIFVSSASIYELPRLLNHITSPNVMIWSAVAASCSVPMIFKAASLLVKNPITGEHTPWDLTPQQFIDGSVEGDVPMARLAEMFNVNHFIVSQVNPHVLPFLINEERLRTKNLKQNSSPGWIDTLLKLSKDEILYRLHVISEVGIFPNLFTKLNSVLSQKYSGDITILPEIDLKDFPLILTNPTTEFMEKALLCGERATWPKLCRIRNACAIELELDSAVQELRARLVFGKSQTDLQGLVETKHPQNKFAVKSKRGYTINNFRVRDYINTDEDEHHHFGKIRIPDRDSFLTAHPRLYRMLSASNTHFYSHQINQLPPFASIDPRIQLPETDDLSLSSKSDDENDSESDCNRNIDSCSTVAVSTSIVDYFSGSHSIMASNSPTLVTSHCNFNYADAKAIIVRSNSGAVEDTVDNLHCSQHTSTKS